MWLAVAAFLHGCSQCEPSLGKGSVVLGTVCLTLREEGEGHRRTRDRTKGIAFLEWTRCAGTQARAEGMELWAGAFTQHI